MRENTEEILPLSAVAARSLFPRGLTQAKDAFRFSSESLLLASFASLKNGGRLLDLGTGCGVTALAALCLEPSLRAVGVEIQAESAQAAKRNAAALGFADAFRIINADLDDARLFERLDAHSFDLVLTNPPYRQPEKGRLPKSRSRRIALFEESGGLDIFCRTAYKSLTDSGRFLILYPAARSDELADALEKAGLVPLRKLFLRARPEKAAKLVLTEAEIAGKTRKNRPREDTLVLHAAKGGFSSEALAFCPFLACNTGRKR
ncbi:MAG: methyltransferase [Desulfovibrio sp.]|jgi:tRNA1Val (adenine37-N6)-methyltransferase|nr:methyltransferase [Desulfovibrio sp.]